MKALFRLDFIYLITDLQISRLFLLAYFIFFKKYYKTINPKVLYKIFNFITL